MEIQNSGEEKVGQGGALKTSANFLIIVTVAITVLFFLEKAGRINLFSSTEDTNKAGMAQTQKYYDDLQEKYKNDIYGGSTPAETLKLFIAALKAGDTELASKYFIVEKQEEWRVGLSGAPKNNLGLLIQRLESIDTKKEGFEISGGGYEFVHKLDAQSPNWVIDLVLNSQTNKWKLENL